MPEPAPFAAIPPKIRRLPLRLLRMMRPGLASVHDRLDEIDRHLGRDEVERAKYDGELTYWRDMVHFGGSERRHNSPFEPLFQGWMWQRIVKLGVFLGLPSEGQPGDIHDWCAGRSVVEIGPGPYPACAAAKRGWKRAAAVDPIARGYFEEGLVPPSAQHIVFVQAPGEKIPLPSASADVVICENCLDHVGDPAAVVREIERLLMPGGYLWFFVDLSEHVDHMHPHKMNEQRVRELLSGLVPVRVEVSDHRAHPKAYGGLRALYRKPEGGREQSGTVSAIAEIKPETRRAAAAGNGAVSNGTH